MNSFSGFLNNAALMLVLCVIYDTFGIYSISNIKLRESLTGLLVGLISIAVMLNPWSLQSGVSAEPHRIYGGHWAHIDLKRLVLR